MGDLAWFKQQSWGVNQQQAWWYNGDAMGQGQNLKVPQILSVNKHKLIVGFMVMK